MTADCAFSSSNVGSGAFLWFSSGTTFTINGNGHSIIGPLSSRWTIYVQNSTLELNNVTLRGNSGTTSAVLIATTGTLDANGVVFRNNTPANASLAVNGTATLDNVQFLSNQSTGQPIVDANGSSSSVVITNAVFTGNRPDGPVLRAIDGGTIRLEGCVVFNNNVHRTTNAAAVNHGTSGSGSTVTDNSMSACPALTPPPLPTARPSKKKKKDPPPATPTATPRPAYGASYTALQTATGMTFEAAYGLDSGVHFRQLDGAGIGIQSIIDAGYLAALDVYGYVEQGVEVCFPQIGRVIFLDARTMPRAITPLESTVRDGMTCASISSPGSLVLMPN